MAAKTYTTYLLPERDPGNGRYFYSPLTVGSVDERARGNVHAKRSSIRSLYSGGVWRWPPFDNVWTRPTLEFPLKSLSQIDRHRLDIQRRHGGKPLFHAARDDNGADGGGSGWTILWHDGGRKNSLSSAPRRPLILLSFRSRGIYSRALFSEDLTKKLRPSNSFESRRAYREIINYTARDTTPTRRVVCLYCSASVNRAKR